jgi:hypothetical protein
VIQAFTELHEQKTESAFGTDDPVRPFTFQVVGDSGSHDPAQLAMRDRMLATPADFILSTGDMIHESGLRARPSCTSSTAP